MLCPDAPPGQSGQRPRNGREIPEMAAAVAEKKLVINQSWKIVIVGRAM